MENFIKLNKKLLSWRWYKDINTKVLFIHLLLKANSEDIEYKDELLERGVILTTISKLVEDLELSRQNIKTSIKKLESTGEIEIKSLSKYKIIKIINYNYYQEEKNNVVTNYNTNHSTNHKIICKQYPSKLYSKPSVAILKINKNYITNHSTNQSINHSLNKQIKEERKEAKERIKEIYIYNYIPKNINNNKYNNINNKYNNINNKYNNINNKYNNINNKYNDINNIFNNNIYNNIPMLKLGKDDMGFDKRLQKSSLKENEENDLCIIKKIIDYLNLKAQTRYRYKSNVTQTKIKARLREGYNLEDFVEVIDKKCEDWLNDEKMEKYLRLETLFSNKFEGYLNQRNVKDLIKTKEKSISGGKLGEYRRDIEKETRYDEYKQIEPIDLSKIF